MFDVALRARGFKFCSFLVSVSIPDFMLPCGLVFRESLSLAAFFVCNSHLDRFPADVVL